MYIRRTILGAFGYVFEYREQFTKALFIPIAVLVLLGVIPIQESETTKIIIQYVLTIVIYMVLAITTHRIILLGPQSVPVLGIYIPRKRELTFVLYSIVVGTVITPFAFFVLIPTIGCYITKVASLYIIGRLSLGFPAIATGQQWTIYDSWKATRGHQVLMIIVVAIFPFVIGLPEQLLSKIPYISVLVSILSAVTMVFVVAALSVAFQVITEKANDS